MAHPPSHVNRRSLKHVLHRLVSLEVWDCSYYTTCRPLVIFLHRDMPCISNCEAVALAIRTAGRLSSRRLSRKPLESLTKPQQRSLRPQVLLNGSLSRVQIPLLLLFSYAHVHLFRCAVAATFCQSSRMAGANSHLTSLSIGWPGDWSALLRSPGAEFFFIKFITEQSGYLYNRYRQPHSPPEMRLMQCYLTLRRSHNLF